MYSLGLACDRYFLPCALVFTFDHSVFGLVLGLVLDGDFFSWGSSVVGLIFSLDLVCEGSFFS